MGIEQNGGATAKCTEKLKEDVRKLLCKGNKELTYSDIKKGLVKYHPDKAKNLNEKEKKEALENYKLINNVKDECYENKNNTDYVIKCSKSTPKPSPPKEPKPENPSPRKKPSQKPSKEEKPNKPKQSPNPKPSPTISTQADCVRKVGTFSHIIPEFKVDKKSFEPKKLKKELPVVSPKLVALIEKIKELDDADNAKDKMTYKHCIYIDFKGTYAKVVAAAMIAYGFNMVYDKSMEIKEEDLLKTKDKNFAFLSSSTIYEKTFKTQLRKQIVDLFNRRPDNINGKYIKYIILDSGYREGLDLFDTKYCHIIQDLPSSSDEKQAIGRNTRLCGQAGLKFHPTKGWPLHVYKYDIELTDPLQAKYDAKRMFDLFIRYNNIDIREINFAVDLDKLIPETAVDEQLTRNIHNFEIDKEEGDGPTLFIEGADDPETRANATAISQSSSLGIKRLFDLKGGSKKRRGNKDKSNPNLRPKPPITKKDFPGMYNYIKDRFSKYTWPKVKFENQCKMEGGAPKIVELTPSQDFTRLYFQPPSAYKGLLLDYSTGSGKTCSAIAIASSSWETAGYTILYVTRHTLKVDVYKNMFRDVCSQTIKREIIKEEINIPDGPLKSPSRMLPDGWMQPISFKQLSNACLRKNDVYRELKNKNGEEDPFKKTLLIIDEAHKMYSTDIVGSERPNTNAIVEAIQHSYKVSGKDSVRLLLMTATPYTTRPMDFVRLMNLMKEEKEQLPIDFNKFYEEYLDDDGSFSTAGKRFFTNDITGYVSYLNRSNDARQFAYPVFHQEVVPMSHSITEDKKKQLYKILRQIEELKDDIEDSTEVIKEVKEEYRARINKAKEDCDKSERGKKRDCIDRNVDPLKREAKEKVTQMKEEIEEKVDELQDMKKDSKKLVKEIKEAVKTDLSQEFVLMNKCRLPIRPKQAPADEN
jgi:hypothetical protein